MRIYQNLSGATRTFYGVTFNHGDIKEVPGPINVPHFVQVQSLPETVSKPSSENTHESGTEPETKVESRRKSKLLKGAINDGSDND